MAKRKRRIVQADKKDHVSRPQAHITLAEKLGIPRPPEDTPDDDPVKSAWDELYEGLGHVFNDPNVRSAPIGSGGRTGRIKQVHKGDLFKYAKERYGIEVPEWREDEQVSDDRLAEIEIVMRQYEKGLWPHDRMALDAIKKILRPSPPPDDDVALHGRRPLM